MIYQIEFFRGQWRVAPQTHWNDTAYMHKCYETVEAANGCVYCYVHIPGVDDPDTRVIIALAMGMQRILSEFDKKNYWRDELGKVRL